MLWSDLALSYNDYHSPLSNGNLLTNFLMFLQCIVGKLANIGNIIKGISSKIPLRFVCMQVSVTIGIIQSVTCKNEFA